MRHRISIRGSVRPYVRPYVRLYVHMSVGPLRLFIRYHRPSYRDADGASSCPAGLVSYAQINDCSTAIQFRSSEGLVALMQQKDWQSDELLQRKGEKKKGIKYRGALWFELGNQLIF